MLVGASFSNHIIDIWVAHCIRTRKPLNNELSNIIQLFDCHFANISGTGVIVYAEVGLLPSHLFVQVINSSFRCIKANEILQTDSKSIANWIWPKSHVHALPSKTCNKQCHLISCLYVMEITVCYREYWKTGPKLCCSYSNVKYCSKLSNELNIFDIHQPC